MAASVVNGGSWDLQQRWNTGHTRPSRLFEEISALSYTGSNVNVPDYVRPLHLWTCASASVTPTPPVRTVVSWITQHPDRIDATNQEQFRTVDLPGLHSFASGVEQDHAAVTADLDSGLIRAGGITPANRPEAEVTGDVSADLDAAGLHLAELHIDRAYLSSALVRDRGPDLAIYCKAWRVRNAGGRFTKGEFSIDFPPGG